MSKHTPGPWEFGELCEEIFVTHHGYATICRIGGDDGMEPDESSELHAIQRANARLIAAAPALLEAMERAEHHLRNPSRGVPPVQVANNLRKAVAAAKGESR